MLERERDEARTRAEQAEAERDAARAEVTRLRSQVAALRDDNRQLGGREEWVREQALREAARVCEAYERVKRAEAEAQHARTWTVDDGRAFGAFDCRARILSMLDAAPAAEVEP